MIMYNFQVPKKSPYYEVLKEADKQEKKRWDEVKIKLGAIYFTMQIIIVYLKIKKKLMSIFTHFDKKNKTLL